MLFFTYYFKTRIFRQRSVRALHRAYFHKTFRPYDLRKHVFLWSCRSKFEEVSRRDKLHHTNYFLTMLSLQCSAIWHNSPIYIYELSLLFSSLGRNGTLLGKPGTPPAIHS